MSMIAPPSAQVTAGLLDTIRTQALRRWKREDKLGNRDELQRILATEAEQMRAAVLRELPDDMGRDVARLYRHEPFVAQQVADAIRDLSAVGLPMEATELQVRELAERNAKHFQQLFTLGASFELVCSKAQRSGATLPDGPNVTPSGIIQRLQNPAFWRKQLRTKHFRSVEAQRIRLGMVSSKRQPYVSDAAVNLHRDHKRRSMDMMQLAFAINEQDEELSMFELWKLGVSNPEVRRAELMVRIKGMEAIAQDVGHVGLFLTITTPSKYHPRPRNLNGRANPKWAKAGYPTPRDAGAYLCKVWSLVRAELDRSGIQVYGIRIAEPHGDACPHWHALFFCPADQVDMFLEIAGDYFCAEDRDEIEHNLQARFKAVVIDWKRGSAAGYCAKYVCKNIDGRKADGSALEELEHDSGLDVASAAERVQAWASLWGIRQFQAIGGPPVGVWRELRRLEANEGGQHSVNAQIDAAAKAADSSNWGEFVRLNGGMFARRRHRPVQLMKVEATKPTRYGEEAADVVKGLEYRDVAAVQAEEAARQAAHKAECRALRAQQKRDEHAAKATGERGKARERRMRRVAMWAERLAIAQIDQSQARSNEYRAVVGALRWHELTRVHEWVIEWQGRAAPDPERPARRAGTRRL